MGIGVPSLRHLSFIFGFRPYQMAGTRSAWTGCVETSMAVEVLGAALEGVQAIPIRVEVDLLRRLPGVSIVGLAAGAVKESAERVRSALASSALDFPRKRVVVNMAPADVRKDGSAFDLPIAIGVLSADGQL